MNQIRAFIAIPLPDSIKAYLRHFQNQLKSRNLPKASWPKPDSMHLTLKFLGDVDTSDIGILQKCMERAVSNIPPFSLAATSIGVFPSAKRARVIWSGINGDIDILNSLVRKIDCQLLKYLNIPKEKKRFSPHLTLTRLKQYMAPREMINLINEYKDKISDEFIVSKIIFVHSKLKPSGAEHKIIFTSHL